MMRIHPPCRLPALRPLLLSLVVVSTFASKILHIFLHRRGASSSAFFLYMPSFFFTDFLVSIFAWLALSKLPGVWGIVGTVAVAVLSITDLAVVSSQFGFFYVTGAEVRWNSASSLAGDAAGLKLMLSGLIPVLCWGAILLFICCLLAPIITWVFDWWLSTIAQALPSWSFRSHKYLPLTTETKQTEDRRPFMTLCLTSAASLLLLILVIVRPRIPYDHISGTIPFTVLTALQSSNRTCLASQQEPFPLSELIDQRFWEPENGRYKGWRPGSVASESDLTAKDPPSWTPETWPVGFGRWEIKSGDDTEDLDLKTSDSACPGGNSQHNTYDPTLDPMRITNLDLEVFAPIQQALKKHKVPIKHIFLIEMESARKDIFPFKAGSHLYNQIIEAHASASEEDLYKLNSKLAAMTPVAEQITGESGNFELKSSELKDNLTSEAWRDPSAPGMGGLNILGTVTGSSLSFKSAVNSHCGVGPIPVDFMSEPDAVVYQPCFMHILKLFNELKKDAHNSTDMRNQKWKSVFLQSITGDFDNQAKLNEHMGFDKSIFKENINTASAKHWHSGMHEINYFGYEEPEIYPYLKDTIEEALAKNERLFLSHFTSTTHHPWGLPEDFESEDYWPHASFNSEHEPLNSYLNAVRYVDKWLGNVLELLEETGIANETLVVMVGDHGQAFAEDSHITGTFENGHISNFRIPMIFRHPLLPRLNIQANTSSISILPTILDLLINTDSLNHEDKNAASDLIHEYEGQSLLRPYKDTHHGRQAWNMGIINTGGSMLSVGSAAVPYRLILPLSSDFNYIFSNLIQDPLETEVLEDWDFHSLVHTVKRQYGHDAAHWLKEAKAVGKWWASERKRLWNHHET